MRALICLALLFLTGPAWAGCQPNATPEQVARAREQAAADPRAEQTRERDYVRYSVREDDGSVVYLFFTTENHPAHPAEVVSVIFESDGKVWIQSQGFTAGDCEAFTRWLKGFEALHESLKERFSRGRT